MEYDFETYIDRRGQGSEKWDAMLRDNPGVPEGIVPLSVADMEFRTAPEIMRGLREYLDETKTTLGYTMPTEGYKNAVRNWMARRHGWAVDMDWCVTSPGVVTAFYHAIRAFTEPGDGVIIFSPVYYPFKMGIDGNDRTLVDVPLVSDGKRYTIDWDGFEAAAREPRNKILLFCSPHNPVGRVWTTEELARISQICLANDLIMLSDEIHNDLIMPGHKHTVFATVSKEAEQNSLIFTAPSKTFSLAGMQTSNVFIPNPELRKRFFDEMLKSALFTVNALGYVACEIAYNECEEWLDGAISVIHENARLTERFFAEHIPQIKVYPLEGTYLQWWDCREIAQDHIGLEAFMRSAHLYLDEGYLFGDTGRGFERINLACPTSVVQSALERLYAKLKEC